MNYSGLCVAGPYDGWRASAPTPILCAPMPEDPTPILRIEDGQEVCNTVQAVFTYKHMPLWASSGPGRSVQQAFDLWIPHDFTPAQAMTLLLAGYKPKG